MNKLLKILKPFIPLVLLAILLLYGQAMADLALPDYMSQIVNNGIQQNGIENAIPKIIADKDYEKFKLFITEDEINQIDSIYLKIKAGNGSYNYMLDKTVAYDEKKIELIMAKALIPFVNGAGAISEFETMDEGMVIKASIKALGEYYSSIGINVENNQRNYILGIGLKMIIVTMLGALASIAVGFIAAKTAAGVGRNLRENIFTKIESFSSQEFDKFSTASLITRSTNDVTQIQSILVMMIRIIFYAPIIGIGGTIKALEKSTSMSWIIALSVIMVIGIIMIIFSIELPKFKLIQKLLDKLNLVMRENLMGLMVIRAFNTQAFEENRFDNANKELTDTNLFVNRVMVFLHPAMMLVMNMTSLLIIWVGAHQIANSAMAVGDMIAFMQYALQIIFAFLMLSMMFIMVPRAIISAQRISEVLDTEPMILEPLSPVEPTKNGKGTVVYKNVGFKFPGAEEDLMKAVNFTAEPGKITAIIGSTGSGKSTLVNLLLRFYDVTEGEILIDGINIKDMSTKDLRDMIGYIPQKPSLFSGTIESNLKYSNEEAKENEINEAIEIAQAVDIIKEKSDGLKSEVSQSGNNLSGGQKQRLSIARALVKKPKIFVIDDSFSALDFKTDLALRMALKEKIGESTVLLIAQRIATVKNSDKIIVLEEGGICGIGNHSYLMDKCQIYREIALSQLSMEELS